MIRLFTQHYIRKQQELDGTWEFVKEDGKKYSLLVPGCWEQHPEMLDYRGKGSYRKTVTIDNDSDLRLEFKGISHTAEVYFDDQLAGSHYNAFTPFACIVKNVKKGEHTIRVEVSNSFGPESALHIPNDYYTYGGITRPVVLETIPEVYIDWVHILPYKKGDKWYADVSVKIRNTGDAAYDFRLDGNIAGDQVQFPYGKAEQGEKCVVSRTVLCENAEAWCSEDPKLYMAEINLEIDGVICDDYRERFGFRTVEIKEQKIFLNGEPVFLKGFNRHEDYGTIGCAIPPQLMAQDLDMIEDLGANAVRTCHYPNDERFLDLCDERGIMVWEENHARGLSVEQMLNPNFEKQCEDCNREMVENHFNHPSIIIWGILNECASETEDGRKMYQKQYEQIRGMDGSRPLTSATCKHFADICLDMPDILSFNIYSGWYEDVPVLGRHNKVMDWLLEGDREDKPVIVSEFGAAAIYGFRDKGLCKWSEERQEKVLEENIKVYREDKRLSGIFIWQFADCKVTEEGGWFATRARCHNNKGIVDEYRRPKMAYDLVKKMFHEI